MALASISRQQSTSPITRLAPPHPLQLRRPQTHNLLHNHPTSLSITPNSPPTKAFPHLLPAPPSAPTPVKCLKTSCPNKYTMNYGHTLILSTQHATGAEGLGHEYDHTLFTSTLNSSTTHHYYTLLPDTHTNLQEHQNSFRLQHRVSANGIMYTKASLFSSINVRDLDRQDGDRRRTSAF